MKLLHVMLAILPGLLLAQEPLYRNLGVDQGLPSSEVYSILQDREGYIWISTNNGVCRYNGRRFECFSERDGLTDNTVYRILESKTGRLWFFCGNGTICYRENDTFHSIAANPELKKELMGGARVICSAALDDTNGLWIGTTRATYNIMPEGNYQKIITSPLSSDSAFISIHVLNNKQAVIGRNLYPNILEKITTSGSIGICCKGNTIFFRSVPAQSGSSPDLFSRILVLSDGSILYTYKNILYHYRQGRHEGEYPFATSIICIYQDPDKTIWVGLSKGGAYGFPLGDLSSAPHHLLKDESVSGILADHEKGIWLTTLDNGIYYASFLNYFILPHPSLSEKIVGLQSIGHRVYAATHKGDVFEIHENLIVNKLRSHNYPQAIGHMNFFSRNGKLVACGAQLTELDTATGLLSYIENEKGERIGGLTLVHGKNNELICFGQMRYGIIAGSTLKRIQTSPARITSAIKTRIGSVYVGTFEGLYGYSEEKMERVHKEDSLLSSRITCLAEDSSGNLLIGLRQGGLVLMNKQGHIQHPIFALDPPVFNSLITDGLGRIWASSNQGIWQLKIRDSNSVHIERILTTSHGLPSNEVGHLALHRNYLLAGTKKGLCVISLDRPYFNSERPPVQIRTIEINNRKSWLSGKPLAHTENNFRIYIDCMSFKDKSYPGFYYMLKGWNDSLRYSREEYIEYNNLPHGEYELKISGSNNDGVLSPESTVSFSIEKPWWLTYGFMGISFAMGLSLIYTLMTWRIRVIRRREEEKTSIYRQMAESRMTALRAQMNPHFIFNAINSIQNFILDKETQSAYDYLGRFSRLIRMVLTHSRQNSNSLEKELQMLSLYTDLEKLRFDHSFRYTVIVDPALDLSDLLIPSMLLQPFVENAIWHGLMSLGNARPGELSIAIRDEINDLVIEIQDNGVGRDKSREFRKGSEHVSHGIMLSKDRLALFGTTIKKAEQIQIIDLKDETGQGTGTKVRIILPKLPLHEN